MLILSKKIKFITVIICLFSTTFANSRQLPTLHITFSRALNNKTYCYGTMSLREGNDSINLPAKFKTRGATALQYSMKPSLNMKLRDADDNEIDTTLLDIRNCSSWILDAMAIDRIDMRNRVCMDIWNDMYQLPYNTDFMGRSGTKGRFVEVYINNTYKGIYCLSDRVNRKLLNLKKPSVSDDLVTIRGVLYKHGTTDYGDQNTPGFFCDSTVYVARWHDAWELTEPDNYAGMQAWGPLYEYYQNLNDFNYMESHFDYDNILHYTLFVMAFSITDNWGNKNQFWSIKNITKSDWTFYITPWDLDTSLGGHYVGNYYDGNYDRSFTPQTVIKNAVSPFSNFIQNTSFKDNLKQLWLKYRETVLSIDSVAKRLYDYCSLFENSGAWERQYSYWQTQKYRPLMVEDLRREVQLVIEWYQDQYALIDDYFGLTPTSIKGNDTNAIPQEKYYDLMGRIVKKPQRGIYIINGKAVLR